MTLTKTRRISALGFCALIITVTMFVVTEYQSSSPLLVDKSLISINASGQRSYDDQPFTGTMISHHPSGEVATSDEFINGRRNGYAQKWFDDGTLGYKSHYIAGQRYGYTHTWWSNGNRRSVFRYINGKTEGVGWRWYRNGDKYKKFNYLAGKPSGLQQAWRKNGKLFSNFEYKNGRIYGLRKANNCVGLEDETISPNYYKTQSIAAVNN